MPTSVGCGFLPGSEGESSDPICFLSSATPTLTASPTFTPTPTVCSVFGCSSASMPVDYGLGHVNDLNEVDLVPVGVTNGTPLYLLLNDEWPATPTYAAVTLVRSLIGGNVQVLMPPIGRTCIGCGDVRVRDATTGICYQFKHIVPSVSSGTPIASGAIIGNVIPASLDSTPVAGAGSQSHLHVDVYMCNDLFISTGNVTSGVRTAIPGIVNP